MKKTRKIVPAIAMLAVAAVSLTSASYAWFTMSKEVTAVGMSVSVSAPNNLVIAGANDNSYQDFTGVGTTDIRTGNSKDEALAVEPASTKSANKDKFFIVDNSAVEQNGSFNDSTDFVQGEEVTTNNTIKPAYVDFTYKIKTNGTTQVPVYVKDIKIKASDNTGDAITTGEKIKPIRFAVVDCGNLSSDNGNTTNDGTNKKPVIIADASATDIVKGQFKPITSATNFGGKVNGEDKSSTVISEVSTKKPVLAESEYTEFGTSAKANALFTVEPDSTVKTIIIRVWYEGQDTACVADNAIIEGFALNVTFAATES